MLRGDMFSSKAAAWFLHQVHNLPIFRQRDGGSAGVRRNVETMDFATDRVVQGEPTVILSEGVCKHERRLRPIQRGTARMMFQAWKKDPSAPIAIVPTGCNYTAPNKFRSSLTITYGEPIYAADYASAHAEDPRGTVDVVTEELERRLRKMVIHVEDRENESLVERLLPIIQRSYPNAGFPPVEYDGRVRAAQWRAVETINGMSQFDLKQFDEKLSSYERMLRESNVTDAAVAMPKYGSVWRAALLVILGPLAVLGLVVGYPFAQIINTQITKRVRSDQFFGSVRWVAGLVAWIVLAIVITAVLSFVIGWFALLVVPMATAFGYFSLLWYESFDLWRQSIRINALAESQRSKLHKQRTQLLTEVSAFTTVQQRA